MSKIVSKEELFRIAKLAKIKIKEEETEKYLKNLEQILAFAKTIDKVDTKDISEEIILSDNYNRLRKDEIQDFEDKELIMKNGKDIENNMFKIPKII